MKINYKHWVDKKEYFVPSYNSESTKVQPNLSLSVAEIYDRWRKNLPLDVVMRNGEFLPKNMTDEDAFAVDDLSHIDDITDEKIVNHFERNLFTSQEIDADSSAPISGEAANEGEAEVRQDTQTE